MCIRDRTKDINLDGEALTPIGKDLGSEAYTGNFNGNGHTITGLTITGNIEYAGLFGCINNGATISNVTLTGGSISTTGTYAGGIVAYAQSGTITGCGN